VLNLPDLVVIFSFFFVVLGFELTHTLSHPPALFVMGFFKIGSRKLFAWGGFEP
jgi:hypothetical protein